MNPKLTDELRQALQQQPAGRVENPDDETHRVFVLIDTDDAGEGISLEEADKNVVFLQHRIFENSIRIELDFPASVSFLT